MFPHNTISPWYFQNIPIARCIYIYESGSLWCILYCLELHWPNKDIYQLNFCSDIFDVKILPATLEESNNDLEEFENKEDSRVGQHGNILFMEMNSLHESEIIIGRHRTVYFHPSASMCWKYIKRLLYFIYLYLLIYY